MFKSLLHDDSSQTRQNIKIFGKVPTDFVDGKKVYQHVNCSVIEQLGGNNAKGFGSAILKIEDLSIDETLDNYTFPISVDVLATTTTDKNQRTKTVIDEIFFDTVIELSLVPKSDLDLLQSIPQQELEKLIKLHNKTDVK